MLPKKFLFYSDAFQVCAVLPNRLQLHEVSLKSSEQFSSYCKFAQLSTNYDWTQKF